MCECQGNPLARVTLALGLPYLLVNRALDSLCVPTPGDLPNFFQKNANARRLARVGGWGVRGGWALLELTDA